MTRTRLLSTRLFHVDRLTFREDDGRVVERDVVVHPGAVVILPILDDGRIVMIRNERPAVEARLWELPAGTREPGEAPIETAGRELAEETGYQAGRLEPLAEFYTSPGILTERMFAFLARELTPVGQKLDEGERIDVAPVAASAVRRMMLDGTLADAKSLAALGVYFSREGVP